MSYCLLLTYIELVDFELSGFLRSSIVTINFRIVYLASYFLAFV